MPSDRKENDVSVQSHEGTIGKENTFIELAWWRKGWWEWPFRGHNQKLLF